MKAFEVWVNGEKRCVAGVADEALINVIVGWNGKHAPDLRVGGLENDEHLRWIDWPDAQLKVGDEVLIRAVDTEAIDDPTQRSGKRTRAEIESEACGHLQSARDVLPPSSSQHSEGLALYERRLEEGHLIGAVDALGGLGESLSVPAEFWDRLSSACHSLTHYEDRDRYRKKFKAARQLEEGQA